MRPGVLRMTSHVYELAALIAAARYVAEAAPTDVPAELIEQLKQVLDSYDGQAARLRATPVPPGSSTREA